MGGTETTATTLRWALIFLVRHREVQNKVYQEIQQTLGDRTRLSVLDRDLMPYTQAVILESQRLGDIAPFSVAHSNFEPVSLEGYTVPAHSVVIPNLHSIMSDPDLWDKVEEFIPERFLSSEGKVVVGKEFVPFSLGRFALQLEQRSLYILLYHHHHCLSPRGAR